MPVLMAAVTAVVLCWFSLVMAQPDDDTPTAVLPRSVGAGWTRERVAYAREVMAGIVKTRTPLYPHFRPAVATEQFIRALGIRPTDIVADIGSGTGAMAVAMLEHGVPFKRYWAVEVDRNPAAFMEEMLRLTAYPGREKIHPHMALPRDARLPAKTFDKIFVINVPGLDAKSDKGGVPVSVPAKVTAFYAGLARGLKPGGEIQVFFEGETRQFYKKITRQKMDLVHYFPRFGRLSLPLKRAGLKVRTFEERIVWGVVYDVVIAERP